MIRIMIFFLSVVFAAFVITLLASVEGRLTAEAFGLRFDFHTGAAAIILIGGLVFAVLLTSFAKDLRRLPKDMAQREAEARRSRGVEALTRGLEAVAVGDAESARHHARVARRNLDESALTRLLSAQAAHLSGEEEEARQAFAAMLEAPETTFLGLRGLYLQAMRAGDHAAARDYADRAFRLRPNAAWAFESVLTLGLERGAWGETRDALKTALKQKIVDPEKGRRAEAALLAADAHASAASGDSAKALEEAEASLRLAPSLPPAAILAARLHAEAKRTARGARLLEQAFAETPHPGLVEAHDHLYADEDAAKRAEQMQKIAARRPTARAAKLAAARRHLLLAEYADARAILEPLLEEGAYAADFAMMADAVAGERGGEAGVAAARAWLARATNAPRNPEPGAEGEFNLTRDGWGRLVREYMEYGRLAPPPLEAAPRGVTRSEMVALAPPPPEPENGGDPVSEASIGEADREAPDRADERARTESAGGAAQEASDEEETGDDSLEPADRLR